MNRIAGIVAVIAVCLVAGSAHACEKFEAIGLPDAQKLLNTLKDANSDTMTRVFAFNALACSTVPAIRQVAMKEALKIDDPIVKGNVLLEILMQRDAILVELIPGSDLSRDTKTWAAQNNNSLGLQISIQGSGGRMHHGELRRGRVRQQPPW